MENKLKHLEFIQRAIDRMAGNLFFLRGWTVTLIAALFALFVKDANQGYIFIIYFPVIIFWILDGYFLSQERLFRALYDHVRSLEESEIDFSMDTSNFKTDKNDWICSIFSKTLVIFYLTLVGVMLIIINLIN